MAMSEQLGRLDAAEAMPWLLDVVFALAGRVRPYNKYLPWELREHPLPDWPADVLLPVLERTLDGDPATIRQTFARVKIGCGTYDTARGHDRTRRILNSWGDEASVSRLCLPDASIVRHEDLVPEERARRRGAQAPTARGS